MGAISKNVLLSIVAACVGYAQQQDAYYQLQQAEAEYAETVQMWEHYLHQVKAYVRRNPTSAYAQAQYLSTYIKSQEGIKRAQELYQKRVAAIQGGNHAGSNQPVVDSERKAQADAWFAAEVAKLDRMLDAAEERFAADPLSVENRHALREASAQYTRDMEALKAEYQRRISAPSAP